MAPSPRRGVFALVAALALLTSALSQWTSLDDVPPQANGETADSDSGWTMDAWGDSEALFDNEMADQFDDSPDFDDLPQQEDEVSFAARGSGSGSGAQTASTEAYPPPVPADARSYRISFTGTKRLSTETARFTALVKKDLHRTLPGAVIAERDGAQGLASSTTSLASFGAAYEGPLTLMNGKTVKGYAYIRYYKRNFYGTVFVGSGKDAKFYFVRPASAPQFGSGATLVEHESPEEWEATMNALYSSQNSTLPDDDLESVRLGAANEGPLSSAKVNEVDVVVDLCPYMYNDHIGGTVELAVERVQRSLDFVKITWEWSEFPVKIRLAGITAWKSENQPAEFRKRTGIDFSIQAHGEWYETHRALTKTNPANAPTRAGAAYDAADADMFLRLTADDTCCSTFIGKAVIGGACTSTISERTLVERYKKNINELGWEDNILAHEFGHALGSRHFDTAWTYGAGDHMLPSTTQKYSDRLHKQKPLIDAGGAGGMLVPYCLNVAMGGPGCGAPIGSTIRSAYDIMTNGKCHRRPDPEKKNVISRSSDRAAIGRLLAQCTRESTHSSNWCGSPAVYCKGGAVHGIDISASWCKSLNLSRRDAYALRELRFFRFNGYSLYNLESMSRDLFFYATKLHTLEITSTKNAVRSLPASLRLARNLRIVRINNIPLQSFPSELLYAKKMKLLDLTGNRFMKGVLPQSINQLRSLEILDLADTMVDGSWADGSSMQRAFANVPLREISLANTRVSGNVPSWLLNKSGLRSINLSGTHIAGTIPNFSQNADIALLDLSFTRISSIGETFASTHPSLTALSFSGCRFLEGTITASFFKNSPKFRAFEADFVPNLVATPPQEYREYGPDPSKRGELMDILWKPYINRFLVRASGGTGAELPEWFTTTTSLSSSFQAYYANFSNTPAIPDGWFRNDICKETARGAEYAPGGRFRTCMENERSANAALVSTAVSKCSNEMKQLPAASACSGADNTLWSAYGEPLTQVLSRVEQN